MKLVHRAYLKLAATEYGAVLLDTRSGGYWQLNPTSATIVGVLLDGGRAEDAVRRLTEEYDVDAERAAADVDTVLAAMAEAGVVAA
ncbi:lasso peptide biosynthesis PqqD family chaperone [Streptomyces sp. WAC06614]|uniref:lasso peptide biosynthesis PqqD family chaperone n=1 Tax=Streptomyces sp. WAC06614 TaxID=2487416 RepID=UPI000F78BFAE|nr:lasso peptide biosynthesis PqqD family chaperone [Streptomyces sp. WAC06614]RSS76858.1 lasso peptide biosynthesis PqqD family chaperone [Streptomyces sp. WAC06614]